MTGQFARHFAGPALAVLLFAGFAPAAAPGLSGGEIAAIWGHAAPQAEAAPRADRPQDQMAAPQGAATAARADADARPAK